MAEVSPELARKRQREIAKAQALLALEREEREAAERSTLEGPGIRAVPTPTGQVVPGGSVRGQLEGLGNLVSGGLAALFAGAGFSATAPKEIKETGGVSESLAAFEETQNKLTFQPRTKQGEQFAQILRQPFHALSEFATGAGNLAQDVGAPPSVSTGIKTGIEAAPMLFGLRRGAPRLTRTQQVAQQSQALGYVVPPGATSGKFGLRTVEGISGRPKLEAEFSARNMVNTDRLGNLELERPLGSPMTPPSLRAYKQEQGAAYNVLNEQGPFALDAEFRAAVDTATSKLRRSNKAVRDIGVDEVLAMAENLKSQFQAEGSSVAGTTQILRDRANTAFDNQRGGLGSVYREISNAYEEAALRHYDQFGDPTAVANFRRARVKIAKANVMEDALGKGEHLDAHKLAAMKRNGVPLTGRLLEIAEFADHFPRSSRIVETPDPFTQIDPIIFAGATSGGLETLTNPSLAALAGLTAGRPGIRSALGRPTLQRAAIPLGSQPGLLPGIITTGIAKQQGLLEPPSVFNQ
jgi:hypothetical protein